MENYLINNPTTDIFEVEDYGDVGSSPISFHYPEDNFVIFNEFSKWYISSTNKPGEFNNEKFILEDLRRNIEIVTSFSELPVNWNENGAHPFTKKVIKTTIRILTKLDYQPEVFPTANESIILEYSKPEGRYLGIEVCEEKIIVFEAPKEKTIQLNSTKIHELCKIVNDFNDK